MWLRGRFWLLDQRRVLLNASFDQPASLRLIRQQIINKRTIAGQFTRTDVSRD
jgi:hypothetical protein